MTVAGDEIHVLANYGMGWAPRFSILPTIPASQNEITVIMPVSSFWVSLPDLFYVLPLFILAILTTWRAGERWRLMVETQYRVAKSGKVYF
jgi:hypothetical protein